MLINGYSSEGTEQSVLGALIATAYKGERHRKSIAELCEEDFTTPMHRNIFKAIQQLLVQKKPVDIITVSDILKRAEDGADTIKFLSAAARNSLLGDITEHISILKRLTFCRNLHKVAGDIAKLSRESTDEINEIYAQVQAHIRTLAPETPSSETSMASVALKTLSFVDDLMAGKNIGLQSGMASLDRVTGGFFPGELTVIGGRPSTGKTAFAINIAVGAALKGKRILFFSREMPQVQLGVRILSYLSGVDGEKFRVGGFTEGDLEKIVGGDGAIMSELKIDIDDITKSPVQMLTKCYELIERGGLDMVIVDYLQLVRPDRKAENRTQEVSQLSWAFKEMAQELSIPVIILSQFNRKDEHSEPTLSSFRESGSIEQDANMALLLYKPVDVVPDFVAQVEQGGNRYVRIGVAKNRQGRTGCVDMQFRPNVMRFIPLARER